MIKQISKKMIAFLFALCLMVSTPISVFADGTVTYDGNAKKFILEPGSNHSPTDLFSDFKGVMPGDSMTQKIHIKNDAKNSTKINVYIKATGATAESADFLSKLNLTVSQDVAQLDTLTLFDAPANETATLAEWVCLGTIYPNAEIDLDLTLEVPLELDNGYQDAVGTLEWQFKVEEVPETHNPPVKTSEPTASAAPLQTTPQTGDTTKLYVYVTLACISGFAMALLLILGKRKAKDEE